MLTPGQDPHESPAAGDAPPAWPVEPPPVGPPPLSRRRAIGEAVLCSSYPTQILAATLLAALGLRGVSADGGLHAPFIIAVSAPTALAIRTAAGAGMTLVALVRGEDFDIFTHPDRVVFGATQHVA